MTYNSFDAIFIGAGPVGLSALFEYLESNVNKDKRILLIFPSKTHKDKKVITPLINSSFSLNHAKEFAFRRFKHYVDFGSYSKGNSYYLGEHGTTDSLSYFWGASCFPFPDSGNEQSISEKEIQYRIAQRWGIQAEFDALSKIYRINGETIGQLKRKRISHLFSNIGDSIDGIVVGYSRLAISTSFEIGCQYCGKCFEGCPSDSPWNPDRDIRFIKNQFPHVSVNRSLVNDLKWNGEVYEVSTSESKFTCKTVFLGVGWKNSINLLSNLTSIQLEPKQLVKQSNVLIKPFFLLNRVKKSDYFESYVYYDNVVLTFDEKKDVHTFTQVYFPTIDLWMRILSETPVLLHGLISFLIKHLRISSNLGRHFGIAMIFFPGSGWDCSIEVKKHKRKIYRKLNRSLLRIRGMLVPGIEKGLFRGQSQHIGTLDKKIELIIKEDFPNLHLASPLNLDKIMPGPHTFNSAIIAASDAAKYTVN